jgi:predicted glutamine amidotransferase
MPEIKPSGSNPLAKYYRQPKIYLRLPSNGKFWPDDAIDMPENRELPVFAMTAKDELIMKTPDALLNGQATVDVIQSCIPNIKNAWKMPSIDTDAILIALRIATYGETMDINAMTPIISEKKTFALNLMQLLDRVIGHEFNDTIYLGELTVRIKPLDYKEFTDTTSQTFEEQRIFVALNDEKIAEKDKIAIFRESFKKLTDITLKTVEDSIISISVGDELVNNKDQIKEFINNSDRTMFSAIQSHIEEQREQFKIQPMTVDATPEEIEQGVPETYEVPIVFDPSNFFA